eukprot:sb/3470777/
MAKRERESTGDTPEGPRPPIPHQEEGEQERPDTPVGDNGLSTPSRGRGKGRGSGGQRSVEARQRRADKRKKQLAEKKSGAKKDSPSPVGDNRRATPPKDTESGPKQNWTSLLLGSRDYLSEHFAFLPLKIDQPITEIFLLCWENSFLIIIEVDMSMHRSRAMQATILKELKYCVSKTQGLFLSCGSILSGKNAKCSGS